MRLDLWLLFTALAVVLLWVYRRHGVAARAWRARLFDGVEQLLADWRQSEDRQGFPRLSGRRDTRGVEIGLECDTLPCACGRACGLPSR